jgi:hypothetical protein
MRPASPSPPTLTHKSIHTRRQTVTHKHTQNTTTHIHTHTHTYRIKQSTEAGQGVKGRRDRHDQNSKHIGSKHIGNKHIGNKHIGNKHIGNKHIGNKHIGNKQSDSFNTRQLHERYCQQSHRQTPQIPRTNISNQHRQQSRTSAHNNDHHSTYAWLGEVL